jgi:hypothetical protein
MAALLGGAVLAAAPLHVGAATRSRPTAGATVPVGGAPSPSGVRKPFPIVPAGAPLQHSSTMTSTPPGAAQARAGTSTPVAVHLARVSPAPTNAGRSAKTLDAPRQAAVARPASAAAERAR